jgi:glucoamylase
VIGRSRPLLIAATSLLLAVPAPATSGIDGIEHLFGSTNVNAVTGHGRLSVGVSVDGDVSVLTWPSPSYADQLAYLSSNDLHARVLPRFGAPQGAGLFLGLLVERGETRELTWLRDADWIIAQSYGPEDGPNVVTRHDSARLGLTVTVTDAVRPSADEGDVMVRLVEVERAGDSAVTAAWLLTYANLSPIPPNSRVPELPLADWLFDGSNDFAAVWDASAGAVIHFHPRDQLIYDEFLDFAIPPAVAYGVIGAQLQTGTPDAETLATLAAQLDATYADGSYLALTTVPPPDQHQVGYDETPLCATRDMFADNILRLPETVPNAELPVDPALIDLLRCRDEPPVHVREGWMHAAADALADSADGELSGSGIAAGEVNDALRTPLVFDTAGASLARAAVLLGAGSTASAARAALSSAGDPGGVAAAARAALDRWLATVRLPDSAPAAVRAVARRSLINLRVGTDAATGAIVASISRQPPYGLDWLRDGAFFNAALDISGQTELAGRRADLYIQWQRREPVPPTPVVDLPPPVDPTSGKTDTYPADAWEMNYYPDGMIGGIFRFEIDDAAFALWTIVTHAGWEPAPAQYLSERWDAIARAANLLARWRDAETGLQAPAQEDDNSAYTRGLHGAVTVYGALEVAARAARLIGHNSAAARWAARACELRNAVLEHLYDEETGRFVAEVGQHFDPLRAPTGSTAWLVWPMRILPWDDARVQAQLAGDVDVIEPHIRLQTAGGSYFMKSTVSFGLANMNPALSSRIAEMRDRLATDHPTPTRHFGEAMVVEDTAQGPRASQRVATPHLWEGILFYLTAMALDAPEAFDRHDAVLPPSQVAPAGMACPLIVACRGDCDDDGEVTVDELMRGVRIVLGSTPPAACAALDTDGDGAVMVDELIGAVRHALKGCIAPP